MKSKLKITSLITAAAAISAIAVQAQDSAATQAADAADSPTLEIPISLSGSENPDRVAKITVSGYAQAQYVYSDTKGSSSQNSGFNIRRAEISVKGELDENWSAEIGFEIDSGKSGGKMNGIFVDKAVIAYKAGSAGTLTAGYQKPSFVMEEYSSSKKALCIEESIASQYFNALAGLSGRHGGVWWDGSVGDFTYGVAFTNSNTNDFDEDSCGYAFYGNIGYKLRADNVSVELGLNATYNSGEDDRSSSAPAGSVYGFEPFAKITSGGFTGILDALCADGDNDVLSHFVFGINATAAYRMENNFEPVVRVSYLNAGDNANVNAGLLKNVPDGGYANHENAVAAYIGVNYYANKYVKLSAGYEYAKLSGGSAPAEYSNSVRLQVQVSF